MSIVQFLWIGSLYLIYEDIFYDYLTGNASIPSLYLVYSSDFRTVNPHFPHLRCIMDFLS